MKAGCRASADCRLCGGDPQKRGGTATGGSCTSLYSNFIMPDHLCSIILINLFDICNYLLYLPNNNDFIS